jgi:hypothetical protein
MLAWYGSNMFHSIWGDIPEHDGHSNSKDGDDDTHTNSVILQTSGQTTFACNSDMHLLRAWQ